MQRWRAPSVANARMTAASASSEFAATRSHLGSSVTLSHMKASKALLVH
jgi:hypothetical protein